MPPWAFPECTVPFCGFPRFSACLVHPKIPKSAIVFIISNLPYVHGALNVDEKKLIAQFGWKLRDERFEPN